MAIAKKTTRATKPAARTTRTAAKPAARTTRAAKAEPKMTRAEKRAAAAAAAKKTTRAAKAAPTRKTRQPKVEAAVATQNVLLNYVAKVVGEKVKVTEAAYIVDGLTILKTQVIAVVGTTIFYRATENLGELVESTLLKGQVCLVTSEEKVVVFDPAAVSLVSLGGSAEDEESEDEDDEESEDEDEDEDEEDDEESEDEDEESEDEDEDDEESEDEDDEESEDEDDEDFDL